eukprot:6179882-Pleurochrysis_carterae.AAC.1
MGVPVLTVACARTRAQVKELHSSAQLAPAATAKSEGPQPVADALSSRSRHQARARTYTRACTRTRSRTPRAMRLAELVKAAGRLTTVEDAYTNRVARVGIRSNTYHLLSTHERGVLPSAYFR